MPSQRKLSNYNCMSTILFQRIYFDYTCLCVNREKVQCESEVTAEEASLRLKQSEVKNIQNEIEALSQMLKQLENQKNDASRRLDDLNSQVCFEFASFITI